MPKTKKNGHPRIKLDELWGLGLIAVSIFIVLALSSYHPNDISYYLTPPNSPCKNFMGPVGAWIAFGLYFLFGFTSYLVPLTMLSWGVFKLRRLPLKKRPDIYIFAWCLATISLCGFFSLIGNQGFNPQILSNYKLAGLGGLVGIIIGDHFFIKYFGNMGSSLIMSAIFIISLFYITEIRFWLLLKWLLNITVNALKKVFIVIKFSFSFVFRHIKAFYSNRKNRKQTSMKFSGHGTNKNELEKKTKKEIRPKEKQPDEAPKKIKISIPNFGWKKDAKNSPEKIKPQKLDQKEILQTPKKEPGAYKIPPIDILEPPPVKKGQDSYDDLNQRAKILEAAFKEFGISIQVTDIQKGPVVTLYEIVLAPGTKIGKITALSDDIALAMRVGTVRIIAPIPGKAAVGIEVPNTKPRFVYLREVLSTPEFQDTDAKLPLAVGMDIAGNPLVTDLAEMPHLLIAGTTGSGKTVCLNTIILSVLYKHTPDEVKLFMVDPKMVELSPYKHLPHLLVPIIHQPKKAAIGLAWIVKEMERRYELLARIGVRNIESYNKRPDKSNSINITQDISQGLLELDYEKIVPATLPYIIIIIDELADLMMVAPADIETTIARLAQLSRAVGIHIILATQRPSVDVLTGIIKANFSTRISFQVASRIDSRTVLDSSGADMLLGKGDLLFMPPGSSKLIRAQGTLVRDSEISRTVNFIVSQKKADFGSKQDREVVFNKIQQEQERFETEDPLFQQAVDIIMVNQQASVSILQRKLRIGYNRAARIIDLMEDQGIVGPLQDGKREILIDKSELGAN